MATGLTILGILLTVVGLIALRPQLTVSTSDGIEKSQPFSVPFKVTNTGLLAVKEVKIYCYVRALKVGTFTADRNLVGDKGWGAAELERGESKTIICRFVKGDVVPKSADIAIVVDYHAFGIPFKKLRRFFRFVGEHENGWQWLAQPSEEIRAEVDEQIAYWGKRRALRPN